MDRRKKHESDRTAKNPLCIEIKSRSLSGSTSPVKIHIYNCQKDAPIYKRDVRAIVQAVLKHEKSAHSEVSIYFVSSRKICQLHAQFFNDATLTDCISFPIDQDHLGEIFVCPKTALQYAEQKKLDPYQEIALYVIHGLLHCLGYDDLQPSEKRAMRKKEKSCMALINKLKLSLRP